MRELIDLFWTKYSQLRQAVTTADEQTVSAMDADVDRLLESIFDLPAANVADVQLQFLLVVELLKIEAEDESCVMRHTQNLQRIVERHIVPGAIGDGVVDLKQIAPAAKALSWSVANADVLDVALLESLSNRVAVISPEYRYIFTNSVNASALDRAPEEVIGRHIGEFVGLHRFIQGLKERLDRCFDGEIADYTYADQMGGRTVVIRCRISPYYSAGSELIGALLLMEELPDRRQSSAA